MDEYKEQNDDDSGLENRIDNAEYNKNDAPDPPVEIPDKINFIPPYETLIQQISDLFEKQRDSPELLQKIQDFSICMKTKSIPGPSFYTKYNVFPLLLTISSQTDFDELQQMGLTLIDEILSKNADNVIEFVHVEGSVESILSLMESECTCDFLCTVIEILYFIFKEKPEGREILNSLSFVPVFIEFLNNIASSFEQIPKNEISIDNLTEYQKIIKQSLSILDIIIDNISDYGEEHFVNLINIFVQSYHNPFYDLIVFTLPLIRKIFDFFKDDAEKGPWDIMISSGLLDICCTSVPDLPPLFQDPMLQSLMYLTSLNDEDGHALLLEKVNLSNIYSYLMSFDTSSGIFEERFKSACKIASNMLRFQPDALEIVLSDDIHNFYNFVFDQGTSDIKRNLGFGIFAMLDNLSGSDILQLFNTDLILKSFVSLETAQGDDLYAFLLNLSRSLYHIFGSHSDFLITSQYFQEFKEECIGFLHGLEDSDDSKLSLLATSILSDYFPEDDTA